VLRSTCRRPTAGGTEAGCRSPSRLPRSPGRYDLAGTRGDHLLRRCLTYVASLTLVTDRGSEVSSVSSDEVFADVVAANASYADSFRLAGLEGRAGRGLAVVTCMDSRIEPLAMLGLKPGDAKIMRNAGARVTDDVLRTLVLAVHLLGVKRIMVVAHTDCKMAELGDEEMHAVMAEQGLDSRSLDFRMISDQERTLLDEVQRVRSWPFLPADIAVGGFRYDVATGRLERLC
jgi:carbonic anhydrase